MKKPRNSKLFLALGVLLLAIAIVFFVFALSHPEASFPWANTVTYAIYAVYAVVTVAMFALYTYFAGKK